MRLHKTLQYLLLFMLVSYFCIPITSLVIKEHTYVAFIMCGLCTNAQQKLSSTTLLYFPKKIYIFMLLWHIQINYFSNIFTCVERPWNALSFYILITVMPCIAIELWAKTFPLKGMKKRIGFPWKHHNICSFSCTSAIFAFQSLPE